MVLFVDALSNPLEHSSSKKNCDICRVNCFPRLPKPRHIHKANWSCADRKGAVASCIAVLQVSWTKKLHSPLCGQILLSLTSASCAGVAPPPSIVLSMKGQSIPWFWVICLVLLASCVRFISGVNDLDCYRAVCANRRESGPGVNWFGSDLQECDDIPGVCSQGEYSVGHQMALYGCCESFMSHNTSCAQNSHMSWRHVSVTELLSTRWLFR